jgi:uncharacterized protein (DUF433 family)
MGGVPCIRSLRIPVATVVGLVAQGLPNTQILEEYPDLELEDIKAALRSSTMRFRLVWRKDFAPRVMTPSTFATLDFALRPMKRSLISPPAKSAS